MKSPIHILHLEDNANDAALVEATLIAGGIACATNRVQTRHDFLAALEQGDIDLILSDFSLPEFDGLSALKIARARQFDVPVIMVSGTLGEEQAVDSLQGGATDYVLKDNLVRLAPAVRRAMQEVEDRFEREKLQGRLIESQKMEMVGQVTGGVAHDFNNILAVIVGCNDLMMQELAPDSLLRKYAEEIRQAANRAIGLTRQLLIYSRKQAVQSSVLNLNDVVQDMDTMLQRLINKNIEMTIVPGKKIGQIKADSGYVGQVLMNLVVNARDAMPNGGKLTITTHNVTLDKSYASINKDVIPGDYVMLNINDTGTGMTDEVKSHLFDAFFTTKEIGKGTGLGLATCLTIVKQSNGHIEVQSKLGIGTTFKIYFPRVEQPVELLAKPLKARELAHGTETLMLVEDDPSVRHLACTMLESQGYSVLQANNGQEGFRMAHVNKNGPIDLVITDVVMPKISGKVMAEWLKAAYPNLKILFTSGYPNDVIAQYGMLEPGSAFLQKPFTLAELSSKVRELLDKPEIESDTAHRENSGRVTNSNPR